MQDARCVTPRCWSGPKLSKACSLSTSSRTVGNDQRGPVMGLWRPKSAFSQVLRCGGPRWCDPPTSREVDAI